MNNFQTILIAIFLAFFVFGVLIFADVIKIGSDKTKPQGNVVIWGTLPGSSLSGVIDTISSGNPDLKISYKKEDSTTYQQDFIEALANNTAPDLLIISPDMLKKNDDYLYKIPFESYPKKDFADSFIDGADIYLDSDGILGFPLAVDPMVLYYNKDILTNAGIVYPPKTWDELSSLGSILTKKENSGLVNQSMIAFGQYNNINNIKDIIATLFIQNDNPIVTRGGDFGYFSVLDGKGFSSNPVESILNFFFSFSNPSNINYSWNRSFSSSLDMFTSGKLVFYLGRASELFNIQSINPNLNFDVAQMPQVNGSSTTRTYGEIYAIVINKRSSNISSAINVMGMMSQGDNAKRISTSLALPPVTRALLAIKPVDNTYLYTFFNSALISRSWIDPSKSDSDKIFKDMIENILSNNLSMRESVDKAQGQLNLLLQN